MAENSLARSLSSLASTVGVSIAGDSSARAFADIATKYGIGSLCGFSALICQKALLVGNPAITNVELVAFNPVASRHVKITWNSIPGILYGIYYQSTITGAWTLADTVIAAGATCSWTDDGTVVGTHPTVGVSRFYKVMVGTNFQSSDVVGIYNVSLAVATDQLIAIPFEPYSQDISAVIGTQLTGSDVEGTADRIQTWNASTSAWRYFWLKTDGKWYEGSGEVLVNLSNGVGYYANIRAVSGQTLSLVGKVPTTNKSFSILKTINLCGNPFPWTYTVVPTGDQMNLRASGLTGALGEISSDRVWKMISGAYHFYWYRKTLNKWREGGLDVTWTINPGEGLWLEIRNNAFTWTLPKPYTNPPN